MAAAAAAAAGGSVCRCDVEWMEKEANWVREQRNRKGWREN